MRNKKIKALLGALLAMLLLFTGCSSNAGESNRSDKIQLVATTTMLADLAQAIGGDVLEVEGLMGPGVDPHLYQASAGDVGRMQNADVVLYHGLHLEGKLSEVFENLEQSKQQMIQATKGLESSDLLMDVEDQAAIDPHVWFDVSLWQKLAEYVSEELAKAYPDHAESFTQNYQAYAKQLTELDQYIQSRADELPQAQRVLVTAHDAFQYFGRAYGFEVRGLQGISTDAEAATSDVSNLSEFIANQKIKAIFIESSVPTKTIEALQSAVKARGFDVAIGGELYSDSLGDAGTGDQHYTQALKTNIDTIVDSLK